MTSHTELTKRLPVNGRRARQAARPTAAQLLRRLPFPLSAPTVPVGIEPPKPERKVGADFDTDWARSYPARLARVLLVDGVVRPSMNARRPPGARQSWTAGRSASRRSARISGDRWRARPSRTAASPVHGTGIGSNYQAQGLKLSKHFRASPGAQP